jgi:hypothetical protein
VTHRSNADDLALHGVRVLGFPTASRIAARYGLDAAAVDSALLDFEATGWVRHRTFAGSSGWSLTEVGQAEGERRLSAELDKSGTRETVVTAHSRFIPLNTRLGAACTDWQIKPVPGDSLAVNDHHDWRWDERVLTTLGFIDTAFRELCGTLSARLARFGGYADLYSSALAKVNAGQRAWVDEPDRDSCHIVWIQFHEDLLATLGIPRGSDG